MYTCLKDSPDLDDLHVAWHGQQPSAWFGLQLDTILTLEKAYDDVVVRRELDVDDILERNGISGDEVPVIGHAGEDVRFLWISGALPLLRGKE